MEGASRPTHFRGVTTVVAKLFNIVLPDVAVFGAKDWQQAAIIKRMVADLNFPVKIIVAPTLRERDGLAMSSRNKYLVGDLRRQATVLWRAIQMARAAVKKSKTIPAARLKAAVKRLIEREPAARLDYVEFFEPDTLSPVSKVKRGTHMALAVFVGKTRLIDNARFEMKQFDYLVLGSGIAGLSFALKVAPRGRVAIVTKKDRAESNTNYAQGGIAAVTSKEDSFELHVRDTLAAGAGLCKENVVRTIVEEGPARIAELIELGMKFSERDAPDEDGGKQLDLGREGGHSKRRILHAKDVTGREIERALLNAAARQPNIQIFENHLAIDLITSQKLGLRRREPLPRRVCVRQESRPRLDVFRAGDGSGHGRLRQGLSLHDQPRHCDRRRRGDGVSRGRGDGGHGVHPVSSHVPLSSPGEIISHQRSRARRRRRAQNARRRRIHGCLSSAEIARAARRGGARD